MIRAALARLLEGHDLARDEARERRRLLAFLEHREPIALDRQILERVQQDGLPDAAEASQDHALIRRPPPETF